MQNLDSSPLIPISVAKVSDSDLIRQLTDENFKLRQIIDEMANALAIQQELIQQLRDEIATLKGQKPKPKIAPSKLEGPNSKPDWHKRIGACSNQRKGIVFTWWINPVSFCIPLHRCISALSIWGAMLEKRSLEISRLAELVIKKIRRIGKPGQPRGKLRKKKQFCTSMKYK